jgi:hypothetical protein
LACRALFPKSRFNVTRLNSQITSSAAAMLPTAALNVRGLFQQTVDLFDGGGPADFEHAIGKRGIGQWHPHRMAIQPAVVAQSPAGSPGSWVNWRILHIWFFACKE